MCAKPDANSTDEIEVTPEMIEAGLAAYREEGACIESGDNTDKARILSAIFMAMLSFRPRTA
jgi:hypothetical protein